MVLFLTRNYKYINQFSHEVSIYFEWNDIDVTA